MCCALSEIKRFVIVMVQLYCCVFTFIVFVGDGWMPLVPAHLPHLRLFNFRGCDVVMSAVDEDIEELMASLPELVFIDIFGTIVGGLRDKQLAAVCSELDPDCDSITDDLYDIIRQWALDRYFTFPLSRCRFRY
jgi:hypothetical protein